MDTSIEIKRLVNKISPLPEGSTNQAKYQAILERKSYDHYCFLECVRLRLSPVLEEDAVSSVQVRADTAFSYMLSHAYATK
jgi:hypothetical protein